RPAGGAAEEISMATLDLRIDYMGPAEPHKDVLAEAVCYKRTRHIAFVRAVAYQESAAKPVATCVATFMLGTPNAPRENSVGAASGRESTGTGSRPEAAPTGIGTAPA